MRIGKAKVSLLALEQLLGLTPENSISRVEQISPNKIELTIVGPDMPDTADDTPIPEVAMIYKELDNGNYALDRIELVK